MSLELWALVVTAAVLAVPIVWMIRQRPPSAAPTAWCELPASLVGDAFVVVAFAESREARGLEDPRDVRAIAVAAARERVGLVLPPGEFWIYAAPVRPGAGMIEAMDAAVAASRDARLELVAKLTSPGS